MLVVQGWIEVWSMSIRWKTTPRVRAVVQGCALGVSGLGAACVERGDDWQDDAETDESSEDESSEGDRDTSAACLDAPPVEDLPNALAWRDVTDDGVPTLRVHVQSEPIDCGQRDSSVSDGTQIRLTMPIALDVPTRLELAAVDAYALMSPGAPGNEGDIYTVAWLTGTVDVEALDDEQVAGRLHDAYGPFDGCFAAPICPD